MELPDSYLKEPISQMVVEALYNFRNADVEFQDDWRRLLAKKCEGDELWTFEPPIGQIRVWGIALVREGRVISTLVTAVD